MSAINEALVRDIVAEALARLWWRGPDKNAGT